MRFRGQHTFRVSLCLVIASLAWGCAQDLDGFTADEWARLQGLTNLGPPPADASNKYVQSEAAAKLGQKFYFDTRFSGTASMLDMLHRPVQYARAASGQNINVSCATCHIPGRAGSDFTSIPGHVSVGAGFYDVNGQQTVNAAYYTLAYWNGRSDSLWAQVMAVNESFVSMNSTRLKDAWTIKELYKDEYNAVFKEHPFPTAMTGTAAELAATTEKATVDGTATGAPNPLAYQCVRTAGVCPATCREVPNTTGGTSCWSRFPAQGKPGNKSGCQGGDATEPFRDAFDCMAEDDRKAITRVFANFAKAIASYEYRLVSQDAAFDKFMAAGPTSNEISAGAKRGAKLFIGKASCTECHSGPFFSDNYFHNVGVPQVGAGVPTETDCPENNPYCDCVKGNSCLPWGVWDGLKKLKANAANNQGTTRTGEYSDDRTDTSRQFLVDLPLTDELKGTWRTPSLRDVALTAPYMHNGALQTLEDVIWHYNTGGSTAGVPGQKSVHVKRLNLTTQEEADLVEFLRTLTGAPLPNELTMAPSLP